MDQYGWQSERLTAGDRQTIEKWRWALTAVYSTILVFLVLFVAAGPYTKTANNEKRISIIPGNISEN